MTKLIIKPEATMEEAWTEYDRLRADGDRKQVERYRMKAEGDCLWEEGNRLVWERNSRKRAKGNHLVAEASRKQGEADCLRAESYRLWEEATLVIILTAQKLSNTKDVLIDWRHRTVTKG